MNFYTEDYWQGEQINSFLYNTVCNHFNEEETVMGGGRKTDWKLHKKGLKDVDVLIYWINACIEEAAFQISGGQSSKDYGAAIFDKRGFKIHQCWGIHYDKGQYVTKHNHFPYALSFNYCVSAPEGSSPFILEGEEIQPVPGRIIFFNSSKNHNTLPNKCDGRCMIVGNVVYNPQD